MKYLPKIIIFLTLVAVVTAVVALKQKHNSQAEAIQTQPAEAKKLPKLVEFGADKCIPCKMMAPILEELKQDYSGTFNTEFIDVWKNPDRAEEYEISLIPTQIFFDAAGKELFRHEGFFSKEDILAKWKEFGVEPVNVK